MPSSKKKDKNAKDTGGVIAAVTKHGNKFSNGGMPKENSTPSESSAAPTPESKPTTPASIPVRGGHTAVSPLLDPVSTTPASASTAPSAAGEWARTMGPFGGSPSNLISLMGESPPTQPSSYEDHRPMSFASQQRAYANGQLSSVSPPTVNRRPLSFQMDPQFSPSDLHSQASSPPGIRRGSMHSPFAGPRAMNPPLPHQPQAHFYSAPDIDFDMNPNGGLKPGERGYYVGFDALPRPGSAHFLGSDSVVLSGYEGGLDVYSVSKHAVEPLASLRALRGGVYDAKVLPWNGGSDPYGLFPLVAVVVHGPVLSSGASDAAVDPRYDEPGSPRLEGVQTPQSESHQRHAGMGRNIEAYQTSVEVYSLQTNTLVDVLLQTPKIPIKTSISSPVFRRPQPTGAFQLRTGDGNIVVSSGTTGECWVYRHAKCEQSPGYEFRCVAKLWTSLQPGLTGESTPEEEESRSPAPSRKNPQTPILSVNGRWLAYCPPAPSSQIALNAAIMVPVEGKAPGLATLTSPVLPGESSDVDQPISDGMMNRIMRETTQEFIHGARWVGKQGVSLWNNYWKPGQQTQARPSSVGSPPWGNGFPGRSEASQFPPTYGISGQPVTKDPGLVSIIDIPGLTGSTAVHHVTTFKAPLGCSFISFAPTGLSLFTASFKGDVQTVWDLMRIQNTKSSPLQNSQPNDGHTTRVRQIAHFSRMTVARIVDVSWSRPNGERIAMVTERGTVHLLDMPSSAYTWPPPRRRVKPQDSSSGEPETSGSAISIASNALNSAYGAARPLINRQRRSSSNTNNVAPQARLMDHASYGGKVIAAGISHSLGNAGTAINHLRHTGDNRLSLPPGGIAPVASCVVWLSGRKHHTLFAMRDGVVRTFAEKSSRPVPSAQKQRFHKYMDFKLKNIPDDIIAPVVKKLIDPVDDMDFTQHEFDGGNTLVLNSKPSSSETDLSPESAVPQAEIESSAPYQPFHTDRRVGLYEYSTDTTEASLPTVSRMLEATTMDAPGRREHHQSTASDELWAFGQTIVSLKVDTGLPPPIEEEFDGTGSVDDHRALPASAMERVLQVGEEEQIVVTTRRRRHGNRASDADEEDFFEDELEVIDFADQRV